MTFCPRSRRRAQRLDGGPFVADSREGGDNVCGTGEQIYFQTLTDAPGVCRGPPRDAFSVRGTVCCVTRTWTSWKSWMRRVCLSTGGSLRFSGLEVRPGVDICGRLVTCARFVFLGRYFPSSPTCTSYTPCGALGFFVAPCSNIELAVLCHTSFFWLLPMTSTAAK